MSSSFPTSACSNHTHASQLFNVKALPRLLKTVAEKSIATAPPVSHHDPATIVQNAEHI